MDACSSLGRSPIYTDRAPGQIVEVTGTGPFVPREIEAIGLTKPLKHCVELGAPDSNGAQIVSRGQQTGVAQRHGVDSSPLLDAGELAAVRNSDYADHAIHGAGRE